MTTYFYTTPLDVGTNGDYSSLFIRFPDDPEWLEMIAELRQGLTDSGFAVMKPSNIHDEYMVRLVCPGSVKSFTEMGILVEKQKEKTQ